MISLRYMESAGFAKKRVLVVDDHPLLREGVVRVFNRQTDFTVCGEAGTAAEAHTALVEQKPDLVVLDLMLGHADGIELIKSLKAVEPDAAILVISLHDESVYAERALRAGAMGYMMKEQAADDVVTAARHIVRGNLYLSPKMNTLMLRKGLLNNHAPQTKSPPQNGTSASKNNRNSGARPPQPAGTLPLSDRELHVFQLIGAGLGTRQIAAELNLSIKTIETYRENIKTKLHLKDGAELIKAARKWVEEGH